MARAAFGRRPRRTSRVRLVEVHLLERRRDSASRAALAATAALGARRRRRPAVDPAGRRRVVVRRGGPQERPQRPAERIGGAVPGAFGGYRPGAAGRRDRPDQHHPAVEGDGSRLAGRSGAGGGGARNSRNARHEGVRHSLCRADGDHRRQRRRPQRLQVHAAAEGQSRRPRLFPGAQGRSRAAQFRRRIDAGQADRRLDDPPRQPHFGTQGRISRPRAVDDQGFLSGDRLLHFRDARRPRLAVPRRRRPARARAACRDRFQQAIHRRSHVQRRGAGAPRRGRPAGRRHVPRRARGRLHPAAALFPAGRGQQEQGRDSRGMGRARANLLSRDRRDARPHRHHDRHAVAVRQPAAQDRRSRTGAHRGRTRGQTRRPLRDRAQQHAPGPVHVRSGRPAHRVQRALRADVRACPRQLTRRGAAWRDIVAHRLERFGYRDLDFDEVVAPAQGDRPHAAPRRPARANSATAAPSR